MIIHNLNFDLFVTKWYSLVWSEPYIKYWDSVEKYRYDFQSISSSPTNTALYLLPVFQLVLTLTKATALSSISGTSIRDTATGTPTAVTFHQKNADKPLGVLRRLPFWTEYHFLFFYYFFTLLFNKSLSLSWLSFSFWIIRHTMKNTK